MSKYNMNCNANNGNAVYGLGMIGAFVYYILQEVPDFWMFIVVVFKSIFWPAFLIFELLTHINMA